MYRLLRWLTGIALHWFYATIETRNTARIPKSGPVLLAASHRNALIDALIAIWIAPRPLTLTAKATLTDNRLIAWLFSLVGVVPLRRAADEARKASTPTVDTGRNRKAFDSILDVLARDGMVLIFPEGKSHSEPVLVPLRTGISRIALEAYKERGVRDLRIVPLGINFEDKGNPGTAVLADIGKPIAMGDAGAMDVPSLTMLLAERLAAVSLKRPAPSPDRDQVRKMNFHPIRSPLAAWGELTHRYLINFARDRAVSRSRNPDDPAMLTIIFSLILILASYAVTFALLSALVSPYAAAIIVATLPVSAYWAAHQAYPRAAA